MLHRALIFTCALVALGAGALGETPASPATDSAALSIEVKEWRLPNGMRVLYSPHRRVPAVTVQVWYHAGSKDERVGARGIAHMFEHMMFKGSAHVLPEEHARMVSGIGGTSNAFTTEDVTAYHDTVPRQYLGFAMQLEAERMRHLRLTPAMVASEREVVKEEKRMRAENSPIGRAIEAIHALAFTRHPYRWTPAGVLEDLDRVTPADCQRFYDTYYVPGNATLIVVGDVSEAEVRRTALEYFGAIPSAALPPRVAIVEPAQTAERRQRADWPSQLKVVLGAFHVADARHADLPALRVLSTILSSGQSSRLNQTLVRKQKLAVAAGSFVSASEHPGLLMIYGLGLPSHDSSKIEAALLGEIDSLTLRGVSAAELDRAKNQLATAALNSMNTLEGLAAKIGTSALVEGDPRAFLTDVARLDRVSAEDVRRVAGRYLGRSNLSLVILDPPAGPTGPAPLPRAGGPR